ncbi:MAG: hypothetical protein HAW60_03365 [Bdellovibrionales bacterium]|nr:hypothetical protein [Bdellovibrionales bacterium]
MNLIKKKWKLFFLLLAFCITLSATFYFFRLKTIEINILQQQNQTNSYIESVYSKQEYKNKVKKLLNPYIGKSLLLLDFKNIFKILKKENIFLNLSFYKKFPNTLKIKFSLNPKFFLYLSNNGKLYKMLSNGKTLSVNTKTRYISPVLEGKLPKNKKQKQEFLDFIFKLLEFKLFANKISTMHYVSKKEAHLFLQKPYVKIKLNWKNLSLDKKNNLKKIIKKFTKVLNYLDKNSYKALTIDARFINKIFVSYN